MKKIIAVVLAMLLCLLFLTGCVATKELTCDHCGKTVKVPEDSNLEEDWIIYCKKCNNELFGDDPLLGGI